MTTQKRTWARNRSRILTILKLEPLTFKELLERVELSRGVLNNHIKSMQTEGKVKKVYEKGRLLITPVWSNIDEGELVRHKFEEIIHSLPFGKEVTDGKRDLGVFLDFEGENAYKIKQILEETFDDEALKDALLGLAWAIERVLAFVPETVKPKRLVFAMSSSLREGQEKVSYLSFMRTLGSALRKAL